MRLTSSVRRAVRFAVALAPLAVAGCGAVDHLVALAPTHPASVVGPTTLVLDAPQSVDVTVSDGAEMYEP